MNVVFENFQLAVYLATNELKSYAKAGAIAQEVLTAIRTVFAFNGSKVMFDSNKKLNKINSIY